MQNSNSKQAAKHLLIPDIVHAQVFSVFDVHCDCPPSQSDVAQATYAQKIIRFAVQEFQCVHSNELVCRKAVSPEHIQIYACASIKTPYAFNTFASTFAPGTSDTDWDAWE